ncbi:uncharacterized protein LOC113081918 isoform X1 [Carassius auratus]|uniref:Uncharacterized protein LOC113081918 isoform X1 n=1 Tax=Carassius auratus TaxID=7957 RepID=A0A6P6NM02_CARAU|nr:uncharacterized protein LOC113081918 isoform X1 [Carassius auratus]
MSNQERHGASSTSSTAGHSRQPEQGSNVGAADAASAIQNIIEVLNQSLGKTSTRQSQNQGQRSGQCQTVDQEMARSFPGFFKRGSKRRLPSCSKPAKFIKTWKPFAFSAFLLNKNVEMTPSSAEELQHMQAGLGKRHLSMTDDLTHSEVSSLFCDTYPKMKSASGGWLLYKASGGQGRRRLNLVPPESEGYSGSTIRCATGGGKTMLYIVPLQDEFDLSPLPSDAQEFSLMPKAECKKCFKMMPLQILALHVRECDTLEYETLSDSEPEVTNSPPAFEEKLTDAKCPVCMKTFPLLELEFHASFCGDLESSESLQTKSPDIMKPDNEEMSWYFHLKNEEDVLRWLAAQVDTSKDFSICVSRINLVERGLLLWRRQKISSPVNTLKITFLGEAGVDTGALRKEFLTELIGGIETRLFEGEEGKGKMPKYSLNDLDNGLFRVAGEVFAVSLAQGGPAPRFLQDWCYDFLLSGTLENANKDNVYDAEFSPLIKMIEEASDLSSYSEQIVNCGYTGPINEDNKQNITRAIVMHAAARRTLMLQQLREGLQLYRLIDTMEKNREVCRSLFVVQGGNDKVDSHYIVSHLAPQMSERGTLKYTKEVQILNHFQDFLMELEDGDA